MGGPVRTSETTTASTEAGTSIRTEGRRKESAMCLLRFVLVLGLSLSSLSLVAARDAKAASEVDAIKGCLAAWGEHPFRRADEQPFKVLSPRSRCWRRPGRDRRDRDRSAPARADEAVGERPDQKQLPPHEPERVVLFRGERHGACEERDHGALQSAPCEQPGRADGRGR